MTTEVVHQPGGVGPLSFADVEVELRDNNVHRSLTPTIKVLVCSWNVGNAPPKIEEIKDNWINPGPEVNIVAVGVQECAYKDEGGAAVDFPNKVSWVVVLCVPFTDMCSLRSTLHWETDSILCTRRRCWRCV
jgi:hypothetical protein